MEVSAKYEGQQLEFQLSGELDHHGAKGLLDCLERPCASFREFMDALFVEIDDKIRIHFEE